MLCLCLSQKAFEWSFFGPLPVKDFFRICNVLPFSCTHLALWRVKDPRYMQKKVFKNFFTSRGFICKPRVSLNFPEQFKNILVWCVKKHLTLGPLCTDCHSKHQSYVILNYDIYALTSGLLTWMSFRALDCSLYT